MSIAQSAPAAPDDEIDLSLLGRALRDRWGFIAGVTAAAVALALIIVLFTPPQFQASGSLYLGDTNQKGGVPSGADSASGLGVGMLFGGLFGNTGVQTQVEILKSRDLVVSAIEATGANVQVWQGGGPGPASIRFWRWRFLDGKRMDAWAPGPQALAAADADVSDPALSGKTLQVAFGPGGAYRLSTPGGAAVLNGELGKPAVGSGIRLILSAAHPGFMPAPGAHYALRMTPAVTLYDTMLRAGMYGVSTTSDGAAAQPTLVVGLTMKDANPFLAQQFLATVMQLYLAQNLRWSTEQAAIAYNYLDGQLVKVRQSL